MFEPKKRVISNDKVAIIVFKDRNGSKHLQVANRDGISIADLEKVLKKMRQKVFHIVVVIIPK